MPRNIVDNEEARSRVIEVDPYCVCAFCTFMTHPDRAEEPFEAPESVFRLACFNYFFNHRDRFDILLTTHYWRAMVINCPSTLARMYFHRLIAEPETLS